VLLSHLRDWRVTDALSRVFPHGAPSAHLGHVFGVPSVLAHRGASCAPARAGVRRVLRSASAGCLGLAYSRGLPEQLATSSLETPIGVLRLAATPRGVVRIAFSLGAACDFHGWLARVLPEAESVERLPLLDEAERQLADYFAGKRQDFTLPLDLRGTDFQLAVWHALVAIPFGETRTYGDVARTVGRPNATRAVGAASGANPVAVIVPCHRVTAAGGRIGGYGGGLRAKRILLGLERSQIFV